MQLTSWAHTSPDARLTLRGWHTPPSGKPLIHFLHGNGFCGRTYEPLLEHLSQRFDLWLCDVQGHGDSDAGKQFLGWDRNAELALQAFAKYDKLFGDVDRFAVGHSFGGVLTCLMLTHRPQRFAAAVALDPVLFGPGMIRQLKLSNALGLHRFNPLAKAALKRRTHWASREEAFNSLRGRGTYRGWTDTALQAFIDHALCDVPGGGVALKCLPATEAAIFNSAPSDLWKSLRHVHTPTLVLHGQKTFPFIAPSVARWRAFNQQIESRTIEGGHCFMQERPKAAAEMIESYLSHHHRHPR